MEQLKKQTQKQNSDNVHSLTIKGPKLKGCFRRGEMMLKNKTVNKTEILNTGSNGFFGMICRCCPSS